MLEYKNVSESVIEVSNGAFEIGRIFNEVDGFYYFAPRPNLQVWTEAMMFDVARKLEALNEHWVQKLKDAKVKL